MPPAKFFAALILTPLLAQAAPAPITLPQIQTQAQQGNPEAQARLGEAYLNSNLGIAQDCAQALAWSSKAAQQGNRQARRNLAVQYLNGCGAAFDYPQVLALLQQAHKAGDKKSARHLGIIYERGLGIAQDCAQAAAYFNKPTKTTTSQGNTASPSSTNKAWACRAISPAPAPSISNTPHGKTTSPPPASKPSAISINTGLA